MPELSHKHGSHGSVAAIILALALVATFAGVFQPATIEDLKHKAEAGDVSAQFNLGVMYDNGQGVPQDHAEAVKWYRKAAEQGNAPAQNNLGLMYRKGQGVPQDYAEALKWYRTAAEQADAVAQSNLGFMYDKGLGVPQDYAEALKWYRKAAEQGHGHRYRRSD